MTKSTDPPSIDLRPLVDNPPPPVKVPDDLPVFIVEGLTPSPTPVTLTSEPTTTRKI